MNMLDLGCVLNLCKMTDYRTKIKMIKITNSMN